MTRRLWDTMDDDVLVILRSKGRDAAWIARFMCCHTSTIHRRARALGIPFASRHRWTAREDALLRRRYPDEQAAVIARDAGFSVTSVHQRAAKLGLRKSDAFKASAHSGRILRGRTDPRMLATQFRKGLVPWNKGTHHVAGGRSAETRFKKGHRGGRALERYQPIGTERVTRDGVLQRKVNDDMPRQARWKAVHAIEWERHHGPIPHGHVVRFRDGNRRNFDLANLELVSWRENMRRNSVHRYPKPIAHVMQLRGALNRKIRNREGRAA